MANDSVAKEHLDEAVDLLSRTTVLAIFYTLVIILYCLSFRLSYAQLRDHCGKFKRQTTGTLVLATVLLICATLDVIVKNRRAQVSYVNYSNLPGGPFGLPAELDIETLARLDGIVNLLETLLILVVLLWRVYVIWSGTRFVIPLTIVSLFFYLVNAGMGISYNVLTWNIDSPTTEIEGIVFVVGDVFSVATLVFMTLVIIARLLFIRRRHIKLMGKSDVAGQYLGIATMLIESYALDTLWAIGILISFGLGYAPTNHLFNSCITQVDILTNFFLIYRVLSGRAWTRQTQDRLSSLRWASNGAGTTTTGTVDTQPVNTVPEEGPPVTSFRDGV